MDAMWADFSRLKDLIAALNWCVLVFVDGGGGVSVG
jgi:hypothetical protein